MTHSPATHSSFVSLALSLCLAACTPAQESASPCSSNLRRAPLTTASLGTAQSFSVLAGSTVTNTGPTTLGGDLGVWPGSAVTGFPPGVVLPPGSIHAADAVSQQAQSDLTSAYLAAAGTNCTSDKTGTDLGGLTLAPGVYCFSSTAALTGSLTLDAGGNPDAVFLFKIGSGLTTASGSSVRVTNGGSSCNVFWQVGSSAVLGTGSTFAGNILALTSISVATGGNLAGRLLARSGAVTLDSNQVSQCVPAMSTDGGPGAGADAGSDAGPGGGLTDGGACE